MRSRQLNAFGGFTLVEVLIVTMLVAVFAGIAIPALKGVIARGKAHKAEMMVQDISAAKQHIYSLDGNDLEGMTDDERWEIVKLYISVTPASARDDRAALVRPFGYTDITVGSLAEPVVLLP